MAVPLSNNTKVVALLSHVLRPWLVAFSTGTYLTQEIFFSTTSCLSQYTPYTSLIYSSSECSAEELQGSEIYYYGEHSSIAYDAYVCLDPSSSPTTAPTQSQTLTPSLYPSRDPTPDPTLIPTPVSAPVLTPVAMAPSAVPITSTVTFSYTGEVQTYVVPMGVTSITVDMAGGAGGNTVCANYCPSSGGLGGRIVTTLSVTGGQTLYVFVGGAGGNSNAGGCLPKLYCTVRSYVISYSLLLLSINSRHIGAWRLQWRRSRRTVSLHQWCRRWRL